LRKPWEKLGSKRDYIISGRSPTEFVRVLFLLCGVLFLLPFVWLTAQEITQKAYNRFQITSSYHLNTAGLDRLSLEGIHGDITLRGDDQKYILIEETVVIRAVTKEKALTLYLDVKTKLESEGNEARLSSNKFPKEITKTNFRITLPAYFPVMMNLSSGSISADSLSGELFLASDKGSISLTNIRGRTIASCLAGDIHSNVISGNTTLSTTAGNIWAEAIIGDVEASCDSGNVEILSVEGDVLITSGNGAVTINDVNGRTISAYTLKGDITVESVVGETHIKSLQGDIHAKNVDGNLDLFSSNGDLTLKNINGDILGWTKNGGVTGQQLAGCINLQTSAGDIVFQKSWDGTASGHTIDAATNAGNIHLELPREFPANFRVEVNNPEGTPFEAIKSDFPLYIEASDFSAVGTSESSVGPQKVNLSSSFGNVTIRWSD